MVSEIKMESENKFRRGVINHRLYPLRCNAQIADAILDDSCDWKARSREFMKKLQTGDVFEAADVLKKLTFLSREKKLSFREQTMLDKSRFLIISEVTNAGVADEEALRAEIDRLVDIACKKHLKSQPRVMSAAAA